MKTITALVALTCFAPLTFGAAQVGEAANISESTTQQFGNSVATSPSGILAVGAPRSIFGSGSVELYDIDDLALIGSLAPADSATYDSFGQNIDIEGDFLAATAPTADSDLSETGAAYIFRLSTQAELFKLTAQDAKAFDRFGGNIKIEGNRIVVGSPSDDTNGVSGVGSVYVFDLENGEQLLKLAPNDSEQGDRFGGAGLDLRDGTLAVGARQYNALDLANLGTGAVYLFNPETGAQLQKITPSDGRAGDQFGTSLLLTEDKLLVGSPDHENKRGAVYVFDLNTFEELAKWQPNSPSMKFGRSLAALESTIAIGSPGSSAPCNGNTGFGTGFLFDLEKNTQLARLQPAGCPPFSNQVQAGWSTAMTAEWTFFGAPNDSSVRGFPTLKSPQPYCTAKLSSSGCAASLVVNSPEGLLPTFGAQDSFVVANEVQGLQTGLALGSVSGAAEIPFSGGGFLCLASPIKRGSPQFSGGSAQQCNGQFQQLINDGAAPPDGFDPGSGQTAWYQFWYRSPGAPAGSALSNAIEVDFQ